MKKFLCLDCDYIWDDLDADHCPECGHEEFVSDGAQSEVADFDHGNFEGDLFSADHKVLGYHQDDSGE